MRQMKESGSALVLRGGWKGGASHREAVLWTFGLCNLKSVVFRNEVSIGETPKAL